MNNKECLITGERRCAVQNLRDKIDTNRRVAENLQNLIEASSLRVGKETMIEGVELYLKKADSLQQRINSKACDVCWNKS